MYSNKLDQFSDQIKAYSYQLKNHEPPLNRRDSNSWSPHQILGHLIDSATNNHQRFVRSQFEDTPTILYNQDQWNQHSYYNEFDIHDLIQMWENYNHHLIHLYRSIPEPLLQKKCFTGGSEAMTIQDLMVDYMKHLKHHMDQLLHSTN